MKDRIFQERVGGGCAECNGNLNEKKDYLWEFLRLPVEVNDL